jgi:hypothetical protein
MVTQERDDALHYLVPRLAPAVLLAPTAIVGQGDEL